jgi:hypothetical protein
VNGWSRYIDDLASASAALLIEGRSGPPALVQPETALVARDVVLTELRQLVGAVSEPPRFAEARELTMFDIVHRPGQSLHQALSSLPRAVPFGTVRVSTEMDLTLPAYEQHWQQAAIAALALEGYVDSVGRLPDHIAWYVLRDLADLSACLPYLDQDLSERLLPRLQAGEDLAAPYAAITSAGHDTLRLVAGEVRSRVPAHERGAASPEPLLSHAPVAGGELRSVLSAYLRTVATHADDLSVADLRALTRLITLGGDATAEVLERTATAVPGAADVAQGLRALGPLAATLRESPCRSSASPHLDVVRGASKLFARSATYARLAQRLPRGAPNDDLRRLAAPALEVAEYMPVLAQTVEVCVGESLAAGVLLVPNLSSESSQTSLAWVTPRMVPHQEGPPAIQRAARQLTAAASDIRPAVRQAEQHLTSYRTAPDKRAQRAVATAVQHASSARGQLRTVLGKRLDEQPAVLSAALPAHPRLAPHRPKPTAGK